MFSNMSPFEDILVGFEKRRRNNEQMAFFQKNTTKDQMTSRRRYLIFNRDLNSFYGSTDAKVPRLPHLVPSRNNFISTKNKFADFFPQNRAKKVATKYFSSFFSRPRVKINVCR